MGHKPNTEKSSQTGPYVKQTPEECIKALRANLRTVLFIPTHQIEALLAEYDRVVEKYDRVVEKYASTAADNSALLLKLENLQETRIEDVIRIASVAQAGEIPQYGDFRGTEAFRDEE